jgi:hypothetical protein
MKKLLILLFLLTLSTAVFADDQQNSEETVTIKKSQLTQDQLSKIEAQNVAEKVKTYGFAAGVGHEIGIAVNESLTAIKSNVVDLSNTSVGKITIAVVVWKVIGKDLTGLVIGISMFAVGIPIWIWSYRRFLPRKYLVKETVGPDGKVIERQYDFGYGRDEQYSTTTNKDIAIGWQIGHWVILLIYTIIVLAGVIF